MGVRRLSHAAVDAIRDPRRRSFPILETRGVLTTSEIKDFKTQYIKQIAYGVIVSSSHIITGIMIGWPAVFPRLTEIERSELQLTSQSEGYLISCVFVSGLLSTLIAGFLMESFGPRTLVLMTMPPVIMSFISQALYLNLWVLFTGRLVIGSMSAVLSVAVQPLVAELCCPKIRGFLSSMPDIFVSLGLLYAYICAEHLPFSWVTGLCAGPPVLTLLTISMVPESPYWLLSKGKMDKAKKSMKDLHGEDYQEELVEIGDNIKPHTTFKDQMKELLVRHNYSPVILVIVLFWLKELAGYVFIFSYAGHLFEESDIPIESSWCPILIGICRLIFASISAITVDAKGRRPLLLPSAMVCGLSLIAAGLSIYFDLHLSCVVAVLVFTASFSIGEGPIVCTLNGELVPLAVRSQGTTLVILNAFLGSLCTTLIYPKLKVMFGLDILFYICAFFNLVLFFVVWEFVPETKNASLCDVKNAYEKGSPTTPKGITEQSLML